MPTGQTMNDIQLSSLATEQMKVISIHDHIFSIPIPLFSNFSMTGNDAIQIINTIPSPPPSMKNASLVADNDMLCNPSTLLLNSSLRNKSIIIPSQKKNETTATTPSLTSNKTIPSTHTTKLPVSSVRNFQTTTKDIPSQASAILPSLVANSRNAIPTTQTTAILKPPIMSVTTCHKTLPLTQTTTIAKSPTSFVTASNKMTYNDNVINTIPPQATTAPPSLVTTSNKTIPSVQTTATAKHCMTATSHETTYNDTIVDKISSNQVIESMAPPSLVTSSNMTIDNDKDNVILVMNTTPVTTIAKDATVMNNNGGSALLNPTAPSIHGTKSGKRGRDEDNNKDGEEGKEDEERETQLKKRREVLALEYECLRMEIKIKKMKDLLHQKT